MPTKQQRRLSRSKAEHAAGPAASLKKPLSIRVERVLVRHSAWIVAALILLATVRIVATYTVFNHTADEPAHVACGMEWLEKGVYRWEPQHPPLARVAAALGPYLLGARSQGTDITFLRQAAGPPSGLD